MPQPDFDSLLRQEHWFAHGGGPRYRQLYHHLRQAIIGKVIGNGTLLPPERDMAARADVSRVTVRKAIAALADDGLLDQRHGSGTVVRAQATPRLQQSLSSLVSFTESMRVRGFTSTSEILETSIGLPTPNETTALGLISGASVARIKRLRIADPGPLAIETSTLPSDILPDPTIVDQSLYASLRKTASAPVRAIQKIGALNLNAEDAALLRLDPGAACLKIDRTGYLESGRPIEFTAGVYRSDVYDFIAELKLETAK